ncbi:acetate--CoA ligase family protein [Streptomyces sp. GQFP]|uniref:acetate--CoA ligase family protein n=1 Tax=Streptomyces sp. GQFP TaxID=2907545 RepID=UPI001F1F9AA9|nr:acetate--CoA ligase family protein [Streptomyces sp. GQFP]UIX29344.1 acetate--CoA ligase family protein [Streptomyces sp. GQFP]
MSVDQSAGLGTEPRAALRPEVARIFLEPRSVAVVGVSTGTGRAYKAGGRAVLDHLGVYGYAGQVSVIHPTATSVDGRPAVPSLKDLDHVPDVVVIAVPARHVLSVLEQCAQVGARHVLVLTAGFGDMGPEGHALEESLLDFARRHGIDVVGPNSTGLVTVGSGLAMSMTSVLTEGEPIAVGGLAVIAQSGAIGSTVVERARLAGVGISHIVSTGNQRDMDIPDFVSYFAQESDVHTVALYVESIRDGALFAEAVRELHAAGKRLVAYLGGRTDAGERAAASHTGKIVGRGALELGLLRALGVTVVDDPDDLWVLGAVRDTGSAFPREWGMVAYSGGMAVLATEQLSAAGVTFPPLSRETFERVKVKSPQFTAAHNPLDVGPGSMPRDFRDYLSAVAADPAVQAVCVPLPMGARGWNQQSVDDVLTVMDESGKPFVVLWYGGHALRPYIEQLRARGVLVAEKPSDLGRLVRALLGPERSLPRPGAHRAEAAAPAAASTGGATALRLLEQAGVDVAPMRVCGNDVTEVGAAAEELGYPVVVKSGDEGVAHRMELGLVRVGLGSADAVVNALGGMRTQAAKAGLPPQSSWLVQRMVSGGVELVLTVRDAGRLGVFGSVGIGGAAVEVLRDIESVPLPCGEDTLRRALLRLRTAELLFGFRGTGPIDVGWVHRTLHQLAAILRDEHLSELEVNPALVGADGGAVVDALLARA